MVRRSVWLGALALTACFPSFQQPDVRLESIRLGALGFRGATLVAQVVVTNPNRYQLRSTALNYAIELRDPAGESGQSWVRLAEGLLDGEVGVAANDSAFVEVPIEVSYSGVGSALRSILATGTIDYRLSGDLQVTEPLRRRVPFRRTGSVSLRSSL